MLFCYFFLFLLCFLFFLLLNSILTCFNMFLLQDKGKVQCHGSWSEVLWLWAWMCSNVQDRVKAMGFSHFLTLPMVPTDKALLMALVERWSPITQTFHLPIREIGVPPINFFMMTGLSMDGTPPPSSKDFNVDLVARCIGP